jgi:hypothetical protein
MTDTSGKCDFKYLYDEDEDECEMFYKESDRMKYSIWQCGSCDIRCVVHIYGDDDEPTHCIYGGMVNWSEIYE